MLKKIIIAVCAVVLVAGSIVGTWFVMNNAHEKEVAQLTTQIATLNQTLDNIGAIKTAYTVRATVEPGQQITEDMLVAMSIPESFINDDFCTLNDILGTPKVQTSDGKILQASGYFAKTYIEPGTPITKSLLMADKITDSLREIDVVANRWPIGLKTGDYVDVRITYPLGEDFIVLSHKRVYEVNDQTLKLHMTEEEQIIYQAALVDYYINLENGMDIYFTKYIEPGVQAAATPFYTIPLNIAEAVSHNPNIVDIAAVTVERNKLDLQTGAGDPFPEDGDLRPGFIRSGRDRLNSAVNADYVQWRNDYIANGGNMNGPNGDDSVNNGSLIQGGVG